MSVFKAHWTVILQAGVTAMGVAIVFAGHAIAGLILIVVGLIGFFAHVRVVRLRTWREAQSEGALSPVTPSLYWQAVVFFVGLGVLCLVLASLIVTGNSHASAVLILPLGVAGLGCLGLAARGIWNRPE